MRNADGSARVFAGLITFLVIFFAPNVLSSIFPHSLPTALWGLFSLAAAALVIYLVRLYQRIKHLETQAAALQERLEKLQKKTDELL